MALDTENSFFDALLRVKAKGYGRQNYMETKRDYYPQFCRINTKYVERKPLVSETTCVSNVLPHFSRLDLYPEDQQRVTERLLLSKALNGILIFVTEWGAEIVSSPCTRIPKHVHASRKPSEIKTVESSNSAELLQGASETPAIPSSSTMDPELYSPSVDSLHSLDADCESQAACLYSSTPNPLAGKRASLFDASTPSFPKTHISLEPAEDSGFEQRERTRSKSFSAAGALRRSDASPSWHLPTWSDPRGTSTMGSRKLRMVDNCLPAGQVRKMSSFQADYWACAIPDSLPPSPDRQSPHWNPNKEYEDLLDYTYPLRPKYKFAKNLKYGMQDSSIHDSGIGLDSLSLSPESTMQSTSVPGHEHPSTESQSTHKFLTPLLKKPDRSAAPSHYRLSPVGKVSFADGGPSIGGTVFSGKFAQGLYPRCPGPGSSESTSVEKQGWNTKEHNCITRNVRKHDCIIGKGSAGGFIRSTRMLPLQNECYSDDEYLPLPPRLKELETLAQQLTDLSLRMRDSGPGHVGGDDFPSTSVTGEHRPLDVRGSDGGQWEVDGDSCHTGSSEEHGEEDLLHSRGWEDCLSTATELASASVGNFVGPEGLEIGSEREKEGCRRDSLAHRIKIFCCRLEELIGWLHRIAEITDNWIPPKPDVESVKASLQSYLAFKKDLASHQALTEGVLQDGEKLLESMASSSPVLQRALGLIAKQSGALEGSADRLYESILEALDALDAGLRKSRDARQPAAAAEASKWLMSSTL